MTRKQKAKFINLQDGDLTSDDVNALKLYAIHSPVNYTPVEVSSEGTSKISAHLKGIDNKLAALLSARFADQKYVSDGIASEYNVTNPFSTSSKLDVFFNGVLVEESSDWDRDVDNKEFYALDNQGSKTTLISSVDILFRIYYVSNHVDQFFTGNGSTSEYTITQSFGSGTKIEVYFNGAIGIEDIHWQRNVSTNKIEILNPTTQASMNLPNNTRLRVRIYDISFVEEDFNGGVDEVTVTESFDGGSRIDVFIGGKFGIEGKDWTRDNINNKVLIVNGSSTTTSDDKIYVKVW